MSLHDHACHASNQCDTRIEPFCVLASCHGEKRNSRLGVTGSVNLPARLDWSIIGCTIRRRALMNLEERSVCTLKKD